MLNILTVGFEFREEFYYALVRIKEYNSGTEYQITVMNGDLEKLLYGNHIIKERNGGLNIVISDLSEQELLKISIAEALSKFLNIPLERTVKEQAHMPSEPHLTFSGASNASPVH